MWILALAALSADPACDARLAAARAAYERRAYAAASAQFDDALRLCEATPDLLLALAQAQLLAQRTSESLRTLDRLLAAQPAHVGGLKVRARALYLAGRDAEAEETLRTAAALAAADADIPYDLGRLYYQQRRYPDAADAFRRAVTLDPRAWRAWDNLGLTSEALGQLDEAVRCYVRAMAIAQTDQPRYDVVYANYAELLIRQGDYRRGFDAGAEAAQRNPDEARNFVVTGKALLRLEQPAIAVKWLTQASALDPSLPEPHYLLAQALRRLGRAEDADKALEAFKAASARAPRERR